MPLNQMRKSTDTPRAGGARNRLTHRADHWQGSCGGDRMEMCRRVQVTRSRRTPEKGVDMNRRVDLSLPEFAFVVATRAALGAGVGLLASARLPKRLRKRIGASLLTVGALTTLPALYFLFGQDRPAVVTP